MSWSFDTWTEFLVPGASAPEWKAVHTHWVNNATVEGPRDRNSFGTSVGVATEPKNDIIVMAGPSWLWNEVGDQTAVSFSRNACNQPNQALSAKPWIEQLCENNYWSPAQHWGCPGTGAGTRSLGLSLAPETRVDHRERTVRGSVTLTNARTEPLRGRLTLELVADRPETKDIADRILASQPFEAELAPRRELALPFDFRLTEPVRPGESLSLRVYDGKETLAVVELAATSAIRLETDREKDLQLGVEGVLSVSVRNGSRWPVQRIEVSVDGPSQVRVTPPAEHGRAQLAPGEAYTFRFSVVGVAPLDAGSLIVSVATADGGAEQRRVPVRVRGAAGSPAPPLPSLRRR
jgi:hypothetical protein